MAALKFQRITLDIYEDDFKALQKRFDVYWPIFLRDIINQHTTPYGANRLDVLDDLLAIEHATLRKRDA